MLILAAIVLCALVLDNYLGEPERYHPLVGFGRWAAFLDARFVGGLRNRAGGVLAWCCAVLPLVLLAFWLEQLLADTAPGLVVASALVLYLTLGFHSLKAHANAVSAPLVRGDLNGASQALAMIVSRDTQALSDTEIATATVESVLENGADAVFAALFWFMVAGIPGVVGYRLANTLDAMWGYKTPQYRSFGWAAARIDDVLNAAPALLTGLLYTAVAGRPRKLCSALQQGLRWKSVNAGTVMASGAWALNLRLGGAAVYHGKPQQRPVLGNPAAPPADAGSIKRANHLLDKAVLAFILLVLAVALLLRLLHSLAF